MKQSHPTVPELSRPLMVDKISAGGVEEIIIATSQECKALAERFGLLEISSLRAELNVDHVRAGRLISVAGRFEADVVQQCVVTLEPVVSHIKEDIKMLYAPHEAKEVGTAASAIMHCDAMDDDVPEPIENGIIDLGELVSQQLAVSLDPYPRIPGAELPQAGVVDGGGDIASLNPFLRLKNMKEKLKK
ncbi:MAG: DUF177 domain-containing protein [Alphaproteobacteria bacterium]|nr:DUF177 domain-containing protein [Alphaproteobacteria bacterium]